jgi:hypothetical protein
VDSGQRVDGAFFERARAPIAVPHEGGARVEHEARARTVGRARVLLRAQRLAPAPRAHHVNSELGQADGKWVQPDRTHCVSLQVFAHTLKPGGGRTSSEFMHVGGHGKSGHVQLWAYRPGLAQTTGWVCVGGRAVDAAATALPAGICARWFN